MDCLRGVYSDTTQLNSTGRRVDSVELSCVAIDTLTDVTQLSPAIGNATDPVSAYSQSVRSRSVELSCVAIDTSPTQLNSMSSRVAINGPLVLLPISMFSRCNQLGPTGLCTVQF